MPLAALPLLMVGLGCAARGQAALDDDAPSTPVSGPHLHNLFETVSKESLDYDAPVTALGGEGLPEWLKVTKWNNGFGGFEGNGFVFDYLFDALSYVVKFEVDGGKVTFSNRVIESKYQQESKERLPPYRTFGPTTPGMSKKEIAEMIVHNNILSDNLNVNILRIGDDLATISDMSGYMLIDPDTLDARGGLPWNDSVTSRIPQPITCAHPSKLPDDPYIYNYYINILGNVPDLKHFNKWQLFRIDTRKTPQAREIVLELPIENGRTNYVHQFAQTENFLVIFDFPLEYVTMKVPIVANILNAMRWNPDTGTRVRVISKKDFTIVREYYTMPLFAYHHVNAYEDGDDVVVDLTSVPCDDSEGIAPCNHMNTFNLATLRNNSWQIPPNTPYRFRVPFRGDGKEVTYSIFANASFDLPNVNPAYLGKPYRYAYGTYDHTEGVWWNALVKIDVETGETTEWYKYDAFATEPNFVARPGATEEDDGLLLSVVLDGEVGTSYLLGLDAKTMKPLFRADAPNFLPYLSHGFTEPKA